MSRDMQRVGLAERTRGEYIAAIRHMTEFLGREPDLLEPDDTGPGTMRCIAVDVARIGSGSM